MVYKKLGKTYISFIILIVLVVIYFFVLGFLSVSYLPNSEWYWVIIKGLIIEAGVALMVLSAETVYYYINRNAEARRAFIRLHICLLYGALIIVPVIYNVILVIANRTISDGTAGDFMLFVHKMRNITGLASVGLAHIYFILVILQVAEYKKHEVKEEEIDDFLKDKVE